MPHADTESLLRDAHERAADTKIPLDLEQPSRKSGLLV
jgi:hypothetical protein